MHAQEPPKDWRLAKHPKVLALPHLGASTKEAQERVGTDIAQQVRDYLKGGVIQQAIVKLIDRVSLARDEMAEVMGEIADGSATTSQIGAFLTLLRAKGETVDEIVGAAEVMRARAERVHVGREVFVDTCGTGGDGLTVIMQVAVPLVAAPSVTVHVNESGPT